MLEKYLMPKMVVLLFSSGSFGLWLDSDLYHGRTQKCDTFENDVLSQTEDFVLKAIEAWAFV